MRDVRKLGGVAAIVEAVFFLIVPVLFVLILPRMGLSLAAQGDTTKLLQFSMKSPLLVLFDSALVIAAAAIVTLALVMRDQLRDAAPLAMRGSMIAASIGAALLVAAGVGDSYDLTGMGQLYATNHTMATTAYAGVGTLATGLMWAGWLAYGAWAVIASWTALRSGAFAPAQNYLGLAWGILAMLAVFAVASPTLYLLSLLVPIVGVIWTGWLAMRLLQVTPAVRVPARAARPARRAGDQPPASPAS
jgi:hypothetical protein